jgi:phage shock protein E
MYPNLFGVTCLFKKGVSPVCVLLLLFGCTVFMVNASTHKNNQPFLLNNHVADTGHKIQSANRLILTEKASKKIIRKVKKGKAYLVDVRTPEEFNIKHLQYATNINIKAKNFVEEVAKLDKSKAFYFYCRSGHRSGIAADTLQTLGYNTVFSIGAIDSLTKLGLPLNNP